MAGDGEAAGGASPGGGGGADIASLLLGRRRRGAGRLEDPRYGWMRDAPDWSEESVVSIGRDSIA